MRPPAGALCEPCVGIDKYGGLVAKGLVQEHPLRWITVVRKQMEPTFSSAAGIPLRQYLAAGRFLSEKAAQKRERYWALVAAARYVFFSVFFSQRGHW